MNNLTYRAALAHVDDLRRQAEKSRLVSEANRQSEPAPSRTSRRQRLMRRLRLLRRVLRARSRATEVDREAIFGPNAEPR
jgi:molybdenum-dependent DNA-binding transcriptional regulator ModE